MENDQKVGNEVMKKSVECGNIKSFIIPTEIPTHITSYITCQYSLVSALQYYT